MFNLDINFEILDYQRNGISGEGFYVAQVRDAEFDNANLIATFSLDYNSECESQSTVNTETCRVINTNDLTSGWRGDRIGGEINALLRKKLDALNSEYTCKTKCNCEGKSKTIYDLRNVRLGLTNS